MARNIIIFIYTLIFNFEDGQKEIKKVNKTKHVRAKSDDTFEI